MARPIICCKLFLPSSHSNTVERCFVWVTVWSQPQCVFQTKRATSHTLGRPAAPGSIREAGTLVVSAQNVRLVAEKLNGLRTCGCVRSRFVVAIGQFGWRGTLDSACLACVGMCLKERKNKLPQ